MRISLKEKKTIWTIVTIVALVLIYWMLAHISKPTRELTGEAVYNCDGGKMISAAYYEGKAMATPKAGEMPTPTGSVEVSFGGNATTTLMQKISASGVRYGNSDESIVFWNKGDEVLVMKGGVMDLDYRNCSSRPKTTVTKPVAVACTLDALMCPDGSGVGRTAPRCEFSACQSPEAGYTGELKLQGEVYTLVIGSQVALGTGVSYALPLDVSKVSATASALVGQSASVTGTFSKGNTFKVETIERGPDLTLGTVSVGETKYVNGISITVKGVVEDSRCPLNSQCIQSGAVLVELSLKSDTDSESFTISSLAPVAHKFDNFKVSLVGVAPEKSENVLPAQSLYKLTFKVTK